MSCLAVGALRFVNLTKESTPGFDKEANKMFLDITQRLESIVLPAALYAPTVRWVRRHSCSVRSPLTPVHLHTVSSWCSTCNVEQTVAFT